MNAYIIKKFNTLFLVTFLSLSLALAQEQNIVNNLTLGSQELSGYDHQSYPRTEAPYSGHSNHKDLSSGGRILFSSLADERGMISACSTWAMLSGAQSDRLSKDNKFFKVDPQKISLNYLTLVKNYGINFSKYSKLAEIKNFILENKIHSQGLELNYLFSSNPDTIVHLRYHKTPALELLANHHEYLYQYGYNLDERVVLAVPTALIDNKTYNFIVLTAMRDYDNSCLLRVLARESKS